MIVTRTPYRLSFFGGGTDYPAWYQEHGGAVLATTIDKYCYISCRYLPPFFEHKSRIVYSKIENVKQIGEIEHPSVRETLRYMEIDEGIEVHHDGDLPARTGLGSSSAFTVGLLHCRYALKHVMPTKVQLATEAIHLERHILKEHVGSQDQVSAACGGFNRISFAPDGNIHIQPMIINRDRLKFFQEHLMLFFTGFSRYASEVAADQVRNTINHTNELNRIFEMVDEAISILSGKGDLDSFGSLLNESWLLKRSLSDKISTPDIDQIYEAAMSAGALGGKLLGAGGGGFMLVFARPEDHESIRERLKSLLHVPFQFETNGSQIIFYDPNAFERDLNLIQIASANRTSAAGR